MGQSGYPYDGEPDDTEGRRIAHADADKEVQLGDWLAGKRRKARLDKGRPVPHHGSGPAEIPMRRFKPPEMP